MTKHVIEVFVDGSFKKTDSKVIACTGIYAVVDGTPEILKFNIAPNSPYLQSRFEHYGIIEAILTYVRRFQKELKNLTIKIYTDCQRAYALFSGIQKNFKDIDPVLLNVFGALKECVENLAINWIPRNQNKFADKLANEARLLCENSQGFVPPATFSCKMEI